jgi:hypothetical protein
LQAVAVVGLVPAVEAVLADLERPSELLEQTHLLKLRLY